MGTTRNNMNVGRSDANERLKEPRERVPTRESRPTAPKESERETDGHYFYARGSMTYIFVFVSARASACLYIVCVFVV